MTIIAGGMYDSSQVTYRIHTQNFHSGSKFVSALSQDLKQITFRTKADFSEGEVFILDVRFKGLSEHQYLLMEVRSVQQTDQSNEIRAEFLSGQEQKIRYIHSLAQGSRGHLSQRLFPRIPVHFKARWSMGDLDLMHSCEVLDISYGGAGIKIMGVSVPRGTEISLSLSLPGESTVTIKGEAVWTKDHYVGVRFHPNQESLKLIRRYLRNAAVQSSLGIEN